MLIGHRQNTQVCTHPCQLRAVSARTFILKVGWVSADVSVPDSHQIQQANAIMLYGDSDKTKANSYPKSNEDSTEICSNVLHHYMCDHKTTAQAKKLQKILN